MAVKAELMAFYKYISPFKGPGQKLGKKYDLHKFIHKRWISLDAMCISQVTNDN